jgi:very-short-patch-repair endonuclease
MLSGSKRTTRRARVLRKAMSLPEVLLWRELKQRPGGIKFRRQHPAGHYVLDFYCSDALLAIEIDGEAHSRGDRPERDAVRDAWLASQGVATLRIVATEVLTDLDCVVRGILDAARTRLPLHHPADGPPPRDELGED